MGCGGSRNEEKSAIDTPLDHWMETIGITQVDEIFSNASNVIKNIEELRETIIDKRDEVIQATGACSYKNPDILKSFNGLVWKLATDNGGDLTKAELDTIEDEPYMEIRGKNNSIEAKNAGELLIQYCNTIIHLTQQCSDVQTEIEELAKEIQTNTQRFTEEIQEQGNKTNPGKIPANISKMGRNSDKVRKAAFISATLTKELTLTISLAKDIGGMIGDKKLIVAINEVGSKSIQSKLHEPWKIVWYNIKPEERYSHVPIEGFKRYEEKKKYKDLIKAEIRKRSSLNAEKK
jgi:hypothetical protein